MTSDQLALTGTLAGHLKEAQDRGILDFPNGIHYGVSESLYHVRHLALASKSGLDEFRRSAAHYRAWTLGERERGSRALDVGKALHQTVLEPHRGEPKGLRGDELTAILGMAASVRKHRTAMSLLDGACTEVTARWSDPVGVECKARADIEVEEILTLVDLKSTEDAGPEAFARSVWNYGYHRQADMYLRGWRACGVPIEHFVFIAVEKRPPHAVGLYELDALALERARNENTDALARLSVCLEHDEWPGLPETIETLSLPRWAEKVRSP